MPWRWLARREYRRCRTVRTERSNRQHRDDPMPIDFENDFDAERSIPATGAGDVRAGASSSPGLSLDRFDNDPFRGPDSAPGAQSAEDSSEPDGVRGFASVVGMLLLLAVPVGLVAGIVVMVMRLPSDPASTSGPKRPNRYVPASQVLFVINAPPADGSRYKGPIDTYLLSGLDAARRLSADFTNYNSQLMEMMDDPGAGVRRPGVKAPVRRNGPPGPGCTVKEIQDWFTKCEMQFLDLPDDECWGYDPESGKVYLGLRPTGPLPTGSAGGGQ